MKHMAIGVVWICLALSACSSNEATRSAPTTPSINVPPDNSAVAQRLCTAAVRAKLKDPQSAQFTDVTARFKETVWFVEGMVNGKNTLGAYEGARKFICDADTTNSTTSFVFILG